jgi:hypothetical protein
MLMTARIVAYPALASQSVWDNNITVHSSQHVVLEKPCMHENHYSSRFNRRTEGVVASISSPPPLLNLPLRHQDSHRETWSIHPIPMHVQSRAVAASTMTP